MKIKQLKGATVRLVRGKETAVVESDSVEINGQSVPGGVMLNKRLGGFRFWNVQELRIVKPNDKLRD
jgi:hypothetical protein